jgi:hypothetical protein
VSSTELVAEENGKSKKKKTKKEKPLRVSTAVAPCYGCGAPLQIRIRMLRAISTKA